MNNDINASVKKILAYLESENGIQNIRRDPYWPKWDSPWWKMLALYEIGEGHRIPDCTLEVFVETLKTHYLKIFPMDLSNLPNGVNAARNVMCHCALGSAFLIAECKGIYLDQEIPWVKEWFFNYQLDDGGFNCDESAYTKQKKTSSIVSSMPMFEALLKIYKRNTKNSDIRKILGKAAQYLIQRRLYRKLSNNEVMNSDFLKLIFPRFYFYDVLRGVEFLHGYSKLVNLPFERTIYDEAYAYIIKGLDEQNFRTILNQERRSYNPQVNGAWEMGQTASFELLDLLSSKGVQHLYLSRIHSAIKL